MNAAMLALAPQCGWTFAKPHLKSFLARSRAMSSIWSWNWQPP